MPNDCDLAALVDCNDQNATITNLIEQKGYISDWINGGLSISHPLINLLQRTKMEFPAGQGDSLTRAVLESTQPNELDGLGWTPVRSNYPGNSSCCNTFMRASTSAQAAAASSALCGTRKAINWTPQLQCLLPCDQPQWSCPSAADTLGKG